MKHIVILCLTVVVLSFFAMVPLAQAQIQSVSNGQTVTVNAHGTCYKVTNNGGPTTMIPTRTASEWSSFINGRPGHIALSGCCTTEGPVHSNPGGSCGAGTYWAYTNWHSAQWLYCWNGTYYAPNQPAGGNGAQGTEWYCPGDGWCYMYGGGWYNGYMPIQRTNCITSGYTPAPSHGYNDDDDGCSSPSGSC